MSRFDTPRVNFGTQPGDMVPAPMVGRALAKRTAQLHQAAAILEVLPGEGESLHAVMTGRYDLMHTIAVLAGHLGRIEILRIATLSFNAKNLTEMIGLLDAHKVGKLTLLCSAFFRDHNRELWDETLEEFRERGQRAAAGRSHAKVVTLGVADGSRFVIEGSANLRTNGNWEQLALYRDATLHDWHGSWIDGLVSKHEGEGADRQAA